MPAEKRLIEDTPINKRQNIRFTEDEIMLLKAAAKHSKTTLNKFVAEHAVEAAERLMNPLRKR